MSFLARLALRARPALSRAPALMPKGLVARQPEPVFRAAEPGEEEEQAQPLRRVAAVRRAQEPPPDKEEEEMRRASAPMADEEDKEQPAMPLRMPGQLRRATEPEDDGQEPAQPMRRATIPESDKEKEKQDKQAARLISRAEEVPLEDGEKPLRQPFQEDLSPGASPLPPDMANQEEPPAMQALRRDVAAFAPPPGRAATAGGPAPEGFGTGEGGPFSSKFGDESAYRPASPMSFEAGFGNAGGPGSAASQRPQVVIDQVDVLIHEPAAPQSAARPAFDSARAMRARYLRRL